MKYFVILWITILCSSAGLFAQCDLCEYEVDLIQNGDFEQGNTGFSTTLNYVTGLFNCPLCPENTFTIGANAILYHSGFTGSDHTNPPFGDYFIANAQGQSNTEVWCQTLQVQPYTTYNFSYWYRDVNSNNNPHPLAWLQVSWNGIIQQDTAIAAGSWQQYTTQWTSGNETTLELCIVNQQWQTGGNDFGLDDISLKACHSYQLSQQASAGADAVICSNETITIGQNQIPGYQYFWTGSEGLSSYNIASPGLTYSNTGTETIDIEFILTSDSSDVGCITTDTIYISVLPVPEFQISGATSVCPGESTILDAGDIWDSIEWSTGSSENQIDVGAGIYSATANYGDCTAYDEHEIIQIVLPDIDLGPDIEICETALPHILDAGEIVSWNTGSVAQQIEVSEAGNYSCIISANGCESSDEINIAVFDLITIVHTPDTFFCENGSVTLSSSVTGVWNTGFTGDEITVSTAGIYTITSANGPCSDLAVISVEMIPLPQVFLGEVISKCEEESIVLSAAAPQNLNYLWSNDSTSSTIQLTAAGMYAVTVSNICGSATDSINVDTYPCSSQLFIPNSFSPNNDGINDSWGVKGVNISNPSIRIYNRFGDMIFISKDFSEQWQPDMGIGQDVYNYKIEATDYMGNKIDRTGHIFLVR